jgi:uncharacterized membrane protein YphA (DoxX/SURF4 family)
MRALAHPVVLRVCRLAIGLIFVGSALAKIGDTGALAQQVHNYRLVPLWSENLLAMTLPWIELLAGLSLVLGVRARAGSLVALASLLVFTAAIGVAMTRGLDFECGCFGTADATRIGWVKLAENLGMLVLAAVGTLKPR